MFYFVCGNAHNPIEDCVEEIKQIAINDTIAKYIRTIMADCYPQDVNICSKLSLISMRQIVFGNEKQFQIGIHEQAYNSRKSVVWQGSFVKRAFDFIVPSDINTTELSCSVNVFVNGAIAGELIFLTAIVDSPRQLNTNVCARPTKKLFISYSHKDIASAEKIAKIHEALGIDVFFDKHRLKAGYIYSEEISKFIQTADTFVLCWSENAAKSDYVEKERQEALALAYPQSKPRERARLRIHPYNIEPHAVPPADMIEHYHFEEL